MFLFKCEIYILPYMGCSIKFIYLAVLSIVVITALTWYLNFKCGNIKQPAIKYQHLVIAARKASGHSIQQLQHCRKCGGQILLSYKIASGTDFTKDVFLGIFWKFLEKLFLRTPLNRSSHWRCSIKKGVPKNFVIFTGKHLCWSLFLINPGVSLWIMQNF